MELWVKMTVLFKKNIDSRFHLKLLFKVALKSRSYKPRLHFEQIQTTTFKLN